MGGTTEISNIDFHWWGQSIARKMKILIDGKICIEYNDEQKSKFNGWTYFDKLKLKGKIIEITLDNGKHDCWGRKAYFGIRNLKITGRPANPSTKRDILKTAFNERTLNTIDAGLQIEICNYFDRKFFST